MRRRGERGRQGANFVEVLIASVLVFLLVGLVVAAVWQWNRAGARLERRQRILSVAGERLERLVALPLSRRPEPGSYTKDNVGDSEDLVRVLEDREIGGEPVVFELEVEERDISYQDYFFEGAGRVRHRDFRLYRMLAKSGGSVAELVTLR